MLVFRVSTLSCRAWSLDCNAETMAFYCSSNASHLSFEARVTASEICSKYSSVKVKLVSLPGLIARRFIRRPLRFSVVHFVPQWKLAPCASKPFVSMSCCDSCSTTCTASFVLVEPSRPHPYEFLVVSVGVGVFGTVLVPVVSAATDLNPYL